VTVDVGVMDGVTEAVVVVEFATLALGDSEGVLVPAVFETNTMHIAHVKIADSTTKAIQATEGTMKGDYQALRESPRKMLAVLHKPSYRR
jgi:hypothetical protein